MYKESSNQKLVQDTLAEFSQQGETIILSGSWLWSTINENSFSSKLSQIKNSKVVTVNGVNIDKIDTTGVYFIIRLVEYLKKNKIQLTKLELNSSDGKLYERISTQSNTPISKRPTDNSKLLARLGISIVNSFNIALSLVSFFGLFCFNLIRFIKSPLHLDWREVSRTINDAGLKGLWVACLLSFLLAITLAYQMAPQFTTYGANVYIVNFLGIAMLKEVSPLITAVIVAGRTGAAITAEIGTRKVQEEIDALQTMGISTMQRIVLPKVLGVMIAVPLITSVADMASMLGGAIVSNSSLDVNYSLFLSRMQSYVSINNYTCGLIKSVAFAFIVALIGCFCGLRVKGNANSIGEATTKSVVSGIVLIVVVDAIFGIIFKTLGV
jgi:phospholipid/cholesterol/gamma-HCH transport system permease protein